MLMSLSQLPCGLLCKPILNTVTKNNWTEKKYLSDTKYVEFFSHIQL